MEIIIRVIPSEARNLQRVVGGHARIETARSARSDIKLGFFNTPAYIQEYAVLQRLQHGINGRIKASHSRCDSRKEFLEKCTRGAVLWIIVVVFPLPMGKAVTQELYEMRIFPSGK